MPTISKDTPCFYLTSVAKDRLPVFRTDGIKIIVCAALDEARKSGGFLIFAYVIMPDHMHSMTDGAIKPSKILQFINGIVSRRVIDHLKERGYDSSLQKLRHETGRRKYHYSLWSHHNNAFP
jgi:REP element-mobilizing transposase RayT